LVTSAATTTVCVSLDYGKHGYDMDPANLPKMPFVAVFAGFFSVLAAAWSKTSFALTLLRLSQGWMMKAVIWFIILTMNAIMGTAMLFMWIKCRPFAKVWDETLDGWCIDPAKIVILYQWSAGKPSHGPVPLRRYLDAMMTDAYFQAGPVVPTSSSPFCPGTFSSTCARLWISRNGLVSQLP